MCKEDKKSSFVYLLNVLCRLVKKGWLRGGVLVSTGYHKEKAVGVCACVALQQTGSLTRGYPNFTQELLG